MSLSELEEKELLARARGGDREAFGELVKRDLPQSHMQALILSRNLDDAWDLALETYKKAWIGIPSFAGDCRFSTWRRAILRHAFLDFRRRSNTRDRHESPLDRREDDTQRALEYVDPSPTPEQAAESEDARTRLIAMVRKALAKLNPVYRTLLMLVDMRRCALKGPRKGRRRRSRYVVVLRYFGIIASGRSSGDALPYREGLSREDIAKLRDEIRSRNAYDLKLLHAREAFAKALNEDGPLP